MTREQVEADGTISPLGKLVVEWLSRQEPRLWGSAEVGHAIGTIGSFVAEEAHNLRRKGLLERIHPGENRNLQLSELILSPAARAAYAVTVPAKKTAPNGAMKDGPLSRST